MEKGTNTQKWVFTGKVWVFGDDINTDYMMPYFVPGYPGLSHQEWAKYCMAAIRPGWAEQVSPGDILIGGRNFGTGSNRPAAHLLKILGLSCLVVESINGIMFRNCVNWVMPALICEGVSGAFQEGEIAEVNMSTGQVKNKTTGQRLRGNPTPEMLLEIMEAGGPLSLLEKQGYLRKV